MVLFCKSLYLNAPNQKFTGAPKAILLGSGSGAILETEIDENGFKVYSC